MKQEKKKCIICGFDKKAESHHIIKYTDYGSDEDTNLVYLCPNHHWIADFGDELDIHLLLKQIKEIGKQGEINYSKKNYFEKLIRAWLEEDNGGREFSDEEYEKIIVNSFNYTFCREFLLGRKDDPHGMRKKTIIRAEILYIIKQLKNTLKSISI